MKSSFFALAIASAAIPACFHGVDSPPDEIAAESDGLSVCRKGACGPALGMPAILCSDGSTGGNTGRCIRERGRTCHWEVRACPAPDCSAPNACGLALGMPNKLCSDGKTVSGPTGRCLDKGGACGWEVISCPAPPPTTSCSAPGACGPALGMPNKLCPDGKTVSGPTGRCLEKGGVCGWEVLSCPAPTTSCSAPGACGPALGMPNYLCPDGKTVAGPGACIDKGGSCGWDIVSCP